MIYEWDYEGNNQQSANEFAYVVSYIEAQDFESSLYKYTKYWNINKTYDAKSIYTRGIYIGIIKRNVHSTMVRKCIW